MVAKLFEYSESGIPNYWIVDLDGTVSLTAYRLVDGEYEVVADGTGGIALSEPAPITVEVAALLPHRA
jgi:Uma2 family endonuclease